MQPLCPVCHDKLTIWNWPEEAEGASIRCSHCLLTAHNRCFKKMELVQGSGKLELLALMNHVGTFTTQQTGDLNSNDEKALGYHFCHACSREFAKAIQKTAEYLERTGRFDELARLYEITKKPDKAGEIRARNRKIMVTNVSVDLNSLIEDIRVNGISIPFKCQNCGARLKIDQSTSIQAIQKCEYCGSEMDVSLLRNLVNKLIE